MSEYRTTATLTADGTFVVPAPPGLIEGTAAEIVIRVPEAPEDDSGQHPLTRLLDDLNRRPLVAEGLKRAEEAQSTLRELRAEWD